MAVDGTRRPAAAVRYTDDGRRARAARATSSPGATASTASAGRRSRRTCSTVCERDYPFAWLGILADVAPVHRRAHLRLPRPTASPCTACARRTSAASTCRCPPSERLDDWPDDRIWAELHAAARPPRRLASSPRARSSRRAITPMRSFVAAPMRHGRLFLAGDAAHIVPPDRRQGPQPGRRRRRRARRRALAALVDQRTRTGPTRTPTRCLERVWRATHFSWWMTTMLHVDPDGRPVRAAAACSPAAAT